MTETPDIAERLIWTSIHGSQEQAIIVMEQGAKEIRRLREALSSRAPQAGGEASAATKLARQFNEWTPADAPKGDPEKWKALAAELLDRLNKRESAEHARNMIAAALAEAAAEERRQCAKIAIRDGCMQMNCGKDIAAAIRAREQKP